MTTKNLELVFKTADGKNSRIVIREPKAGLTADVVRPAMESITTSALFNKDGKNPYATVHEARYVERRVSAII